MKDAKDVRFRRPDGILVLPPKLGPEARRKIRSHAMRDFRRRQREEKEAADHTSTSPARLAIPVQNSGCSSSDGRSKHIDSHQASRSSVVNGSPWLKDNEMISKTTIVSDSLGCGDFFRYTLAELFGASLVGKNPHSTAITRYRHYVATTRSDVVRSADDSLCLILPACTLNDDRVLFESRKRHLAAIQHMRRALELGTTDPETLLSCAVEFLFLACFKPLASDVTSLYEGVVQLARRYSDSLISSRMPLKMSLSVQVRQIMLLRSLANRTPLPFEVDLLEELPAVSTLLPDITESLIQLAVRLPGLLHTARDARESALTGFGTVADVFTDLLSLECSFIQWQLHHCPLPFRTVIKPPRTLRPQQPLMPSYEDRVLGNVGLSLENPNLSLHCQTLCHICFLLLRECLAELSAAKGDMLLERKYTQETTDAADTLCQLAINLVEQSSGLLGKALSASAPLHFARQWYETNGDAQGVAWVLEQEARIQEDIPFLVWDSLLPLGLISLFMQG